MNKYFDSFYQRLCGPLNVVIATIARRFVECQKYVNNWHWTFFAFLLSAFFSIGVHLVFAAIMWSVGWLFHPSGMFLGSLIATGVIHAMVVVYRFCRFYTDTIRHPRPGREWRCFIEEQLELFALSTNWRVIGLMLILEVSFIGTVCIHGGCMLLLSWVAGYLTRDPNMATAMAVSSLIVTGALHLTLVGYLLVRYHLESASRERRQPRTWAQHYENVLRLIFLPLESIWVLKDGPVAYNP